MSLYVLVVMGLGITILATLAYRFSKQNPVLFAFWSYEHETCNLTIANLEEQTTLQRQSPGACNYIIEEINGYPELIQFDQGTGTIKLLRVTHREIVVSERIQISLSLTDIPQLSIDGTELYFSAIMNDIERLYVMDIKTNQVELLIPDSQGIVTQPKLSPDKRYLTYIQLDGLRNRYECLHLPQTAYTEIVNPECLGNGDLYLMDLQTNEVVNLTALVADDLYSACRPQWSTNSQFLIVSGSCLEQGGIALIDIVNNYQVIHFPESLSSGGWLSDNYVLFSVHNEDFTGFRTVAYSVTDQTYVTLPENILPSNSKYLSTSSNGCLVVDSQEETILTIHDSVKFFL